MRQRRHHRRRRYGDSPTPATKKLSSKAVSAAVLLVLVVFLGSKTLSFFGVGNAIRATAAMLEVEGSGIVNVSVDGGPLKRAENDLKLYAGDTVVSSPRNYATLSFFDGTVVRIDESTQIDIVESMQGEEKSTLKTELHEGTLWVATPPLSTFSGSITRTIASPYISVSIPSKAEVVMAPRSISVFSADGLGLTVTVAGTNETVIVGEGQQFTLPIGGEESPDLYVHRNPLNPQQILSEFVEQSRNRYAGIQAKDSEDTADTTVNPTNEVILEVRSPKDGTTIDSSIVEVSGRIGEDVDKVRINGYLANVDNGTFTQELALPDEDEVNITIEAVDENGVVISEALRTVHRNRKPPEPPTITSPASAGETYRTASTEIEISGKAPEGAIGIIVNDYRLQLFQPGDTDWSYLANVTFDNYKFGTNVYNVIAINRGGYRSEVATITVILAEGVDEGVVTEGEGVEGESVAPQPPKTAEEAELPNNLPLMPGSITMYSPATGTEFATSELENLIEGNVPAETDSVWVNGYKLRLFEPGKGFFNYIASTDLNTLKRGRNTYEIIARSDSGHILDKVEYVITLQP